MTKTFWIRDCYVTISEKVIFIYDRSLGVNWASRGKFKGTYEEAEEAVAQWKARVYY